MGLDLSTYQSVTGKTVSDDVLYTAHTLRAMRRLEALLGYTLDPTLVETNLYNELGKTSTDFACPIVNIDELEDPDPVEGAYRLFPFNPYDTAHMVDPYTLIYKVKLVYVKQGESPNGVTLKTFDDENVLQYGGEAWSKYISLGHGDYEPYVYNISWGWGCLHDHRLQLAVDAEWEFQDEIPGALIDVWADMVTFNADTGRDIKSESILTHSYTKFDRLPPEQESYYASIVSKYAGPNGTASRNYAL